MNTKKMTLLFMTGVAFVLARPAAAQMNTTIRILVPTEDAKVYFDDTLTQQMGLDRLFQSSAEGLDPNKIYHYNIRVEAFPEGALVDKVLPVDFHAGDYINITFSWQRDAKTRALQLMGTYNVAAAPVVVQPTCGTTYGATYTAPTYTYPESGYSEPSYEYSSPTYYGYGGYGGGFRHYRGYGGGYGGGFRGGRGRR